MATKTATKKRPAAPRPAGVRYFNTAGKLVTDTTGKIKDSDLYYVQPDGSYVKDGDRRSPGWLKKPARKKLAKKTR